MNLKNIHAFLVSAASLLAFFFGVWCTNHYLDDRSIGYLVAALGSFATCAGLATYVVWFLRSMKGVAI